MSKYQLTKIAEFPALGGYPESEIDAEMKKDKYTPTTVGVFTIYAIEAHRSGGRWKMSVVPWGAETKIDKGNIVSVKINGRWTRLSSLPHWKKNKTEQAVYDELLEAYDDVFDKGVVKSIADILKKDRKEILKNMGISCLAGTPSGREIPVEWILNDFGHKSIKYYKDNNHDGRFNKGDKLINDFMHSSPSTEVWSDLSSSNRSYLRGFARARYIAKKLKGASDFNLLFNNALLGHSHGCIHLFPNDVDTMVKKGHLKKRGIVQVHPYDEPSKTRIIVNRKRTLSFEVHFFPKDSKVIVYQTAKVPSSSTRGLVAP